MIFDVKTAKIETELSPIFAFREGWCIDCAFVSVKHLNEASSRRVVGYGAAESGKYSRVPIIRRPIHRLSRFNSTFLK